MANKIRGISTGSFAVSLVSSSVTAMCLSLTPVAAQARPASPEADTSPTTQTEDSAPANEIVVTAQGRKQRLRDVPISASVESGEALVKNNITNLEQVAARLPNVRIAQAPLSDFINVRGVGSSLNLGFEQSVATFVDGVYRGRSRSTRAALFDIDRVEILRGPQTTFFGNNAIAGALNITTRKPADALEANAKAFYAPNTEEFTVEAGISVPVSSTLAVRLAGRTSGMDGYVHNTQLAKDGPHIRDAIGRASAVWKPTSGVTVDGRLDVGRSRTRGQFNTELTGCPPPPAFGAPAGVCARALAAQGPGLDDTLDRQSQANPSFFNYDYLEGALSTSIDIGQDTLRFITGYFHHSYHQATDVIPIAAAKGGSVVNEPYGSLVDVNERYNQFSQEVRLASPDSGFLSYLVGAYYMHGNLNFDDYQGLYFQPFGLRSGGEYTATTPVVLSVINREKSNNYSGFGSVTLRPIQGLRINGGLRYTSISKTAFRNARVGTTTNFVPLPNSSNFNPGNATTQTSLLGALGVSPSNFATPHRTDHKLLPTASVQYDLTDRVMAYASYSKGFKAGGYSVFFSNSEFAPETVDAYEVGVKASLFANRLTLNLALFDSKYKNLQETTTITLPSGAAGQIVGNVAASTAKGIELSSSLKVATGLTISTDLAYLKSHYDNYQNAPCTALQMVGHTVCTQDLSGKSRAFAPKYSGNVDVAYDFPLNDALHVSMDGSVYFTSSFYQQPLADPLQEQPGFAKIDARIAVASRNDKWELAVIGKNLTNKLTASYRQLVPTTFGAIQALADPPRSVGVQFSVRY